MRGAYFQFMRIALKLLLNIYWNQVKMPGSGIRPQDVPEINDAQKWLEANQ